MPRYKCKWFRGSCPSVPPNLQPPVFEVSMSFLNFIRQECTGSVLGAGLICLGSTGSQDWSTSNFSSTQLFGDIVMYIERTIQIHTKMKSSYSVLPLSYIINFCIFMSVCCFSNGAYLLVLVIEQILTSYSHKQWSLQFAAVFKIGIIQFLAKFIAICYIHFSKNQLLTKCYTASYL